MDTPAPISTTIPAEKSRRPLKQLIFPYFLIAPTLLLVIVFTILPAVRTVIDSLYSPPRNVRDPSEFVGLENYADLFDPDHFLGARFTQILGNTILFTVATVAVSMPIALTFALLLNRKIRGLSLWRFSLFYPSLLPLIGAANIWAFIYSDSIGLANTVLRSLGLQGQNWVGDPDLVLWSVVVLNIWKQAGYFMIFYLAGLQGISKEIYEAADIEGANGWQSLLYLTLPLLRRTTLFLLVIAFTFGFQTVEQLQVMGEGGPGDRSNLLLYFITQIIPERRNWGYVNATTVLLVAILLIFTVSNFVLFERGGKEDD